MRSEPPTAFTQIPQHPSAEEKLYDPLPLCIYTTIGLIAWLITPPLTVAIFGTLGVVGYARARRRGLAKSRCKLGDTRLVIAYLAVAAIAGIAGIAGIAVTAYNVFRLVS
jgi:hypothetical protein